MSKRLPIVYLNHSKAHELAERFPGRIGIIMSPSRLRPPKGLPYVLDNDRYSCWARGKEWDERAFLSMLDRYPHPEWVLCPDLVGDAAGTFEEWVRWAPKLNGFRLAFAAQDGMTVDSIERHAGLSSDEVLFLGGTTIWKRRMVWEFGQAFDHTHVGRVNYERWLWNAQRCGCESTDGTGWFRGDQRQYQGLIRYLGRSSKRLSPRQMELEFSDCF